jgi:hypothetical protein
MKKIPYSFVCQSCDKHSENRNMKFEGRAKRACQILSRGKYCKCGHRYATIHFHNDKIFDTDVPF